MLLALFRAGNTPTSGEYKDAVAKELKFILTKVEKADKDSLYVTDVRGTQLQSKIGPYVDTFLVNLVLCGHAAYRTQLFVYLKACGREELSTMNLWAGADAPVPA